MQPINISALEESALLPPEGDGSDEQVHTIARLLSQALRSSLATSVDPRSLSTRAKIPFKVVYLSELLLHRAAELGATACDLLERNRVVSAFIITRGFLETTAVIWCLRHRTRRALRTKSHGELDLLGDFLMRGLQGSRNAGGAQPKALGVGTLVDQVSKDVPEFARSYAELCEFTHPNWAGVQGAYSAVDHERLVADLGVSIVPRRIGTSALVGATLQFVNAYNDLAAILPEFILICENALSEPSGT